MGVWSNIFGSRDSSVAVASKQDSVQACMHEGSRSKNQAIVNISKIYISYLALFNDLKSRLRASGGYLNLRQNLTKNMNGLGNLIKAAGKVAKGSNDEKVLEYAAKLIEDFNDYIKKNPIN